MMSQNFRSKVSFMKAATCLGVTLLIGTSLPLPPVQAQTEANNAAPVCMARTAENGSTINIILPASNQGAMRAKGFLPVPCSEHFGTVQQREAYRDQICLAASRGDRTLQDTYELRLGERPAVLCGMAELAISRWKRGGRK